MTLRATSCPQLRAWTGLLLQMKMDARTTTDAGDRRLNTRTRTFGFKRRRREKGGWEGRDTYRMMGFGYGGGGGGGADCISAKRRTFQST